MYSNLVLVGLTLLLCNLFRSRVHLTVLDIFSAGLVICRVNGFCYRILLALLYDNYFCNLMLLEIVIIVMGRFDIDVQNFYPHS